MFKIWNMILIVLSFCLMILGTFVTRTGVISSVHSFARSSLGVPFLGFTALVLVGSVALDRQPLGPAEEREQTRFAALARGDVPVEQLRVHDVDVHGVRGHVLLDVLRTVDGEKLTVGPPVYNQLIGPQVAALILLMGIGPLVAWHKSSPEALGKMIWKPAVFAVAVMVLLFVTGVNMIFVRDRLWAGGVLRWRSR